jgi:hypothetical protein
VGRLHHPAAFEARTHQRHVDAPAGEIVVAIGIITDAAAVARGGTGDTTTITTTIRTFRRLSRRRHVVVRLGSFVIAPAAAGPIEGNCWSRHSSVESVAGVDEVRGYGDGKQRRQRHLVVAQGAVQGQRWPLQAVETKHG